MSSPLLFLERRKGMSTAFREYAKDRVKKLELLYEERNNDITNEDIDVCLKEVMSRDLFEVTKQLDRIADILERRK